MTFTDESNLASTLQEEQPVVPRGFSDELS